MQPLKDFSGRLVGYARVSTDDQRLDLQIDALTAAGVEPDSIFSEKRSGKNMDRPQFKRMMRVIRPGDCVVVWKLDRLGRSMIGVLETIEQFKREQVHFRVIQDSLDTTTPMGSFIMHIFAAIAQLERDMISSRTQAGVDAAKKRGVQFGRAHYILSSPARLKAFHKMATGDGGLSKHSPLEIIQEMNRVDKSAPQYSHPQSFRNWYQKGYPGLKEALKAAGLPMPKNLPMPKRRTKK